MGRIGRMVNPDRGYRTAYPARSADPARWHVVRVLSVLWLIVGFLNAKRAELAPEVEERPAVGREAAVDDVADED